MHKVLVLLFIFGCQVDRDMTNLSADDINILSRYAEMSKTHQVQLSDNDEPGQPLTICLHFVDKDDKKALANRRIHFYQADVNGNYNPSVSGNESTARLNGEAITNENGNILMKTVLPGDYGSSTDNRHIHTTVFGAKPEAYDIHFRQYTGHMGANFINGSDQHFLVDLKKDSQNNLVGFLTIEVKNP